MANFLSGTRRKFVQYGTLVGVGAQTLLHTGSLRAGVADGKEKAGLAAAWPEMQYRKLGRTGHNSSRLVFGCGATLSGEPHDDLLDAAFDAGVNTFDVGFEDYYSDAERHLAPFLKKRGDDVFLISKAYVPVDIDWDETITLGQAKEAAKGWSGFLDRSLKGMQIEHVDAYYYMASNNVSVITNEEIHRAFEDAKAAGKVSHLGLSTHQNAANVLSAAVDTGWFSLAMIAITPGGWYDWEDKSILEGTPKMKDLRPLLDRARESGMGLVGMKAGRFLAGRQWLGWGNPDAFNEFYDNKLLKAKLSEFQKSYAFVLENGLDVVNADMQTMLHLKENFVAAATSADYSDIA
ncbi:MAG: putative aldo/keto reductase-like oxidoreductase [Limisphaerales bacterium]|jgi:predicted aldo/keto reductase-like oxidoreductase